MVSILNFLKKNTLNIPIPIGTALARIPYSIRPGIGSVYNRQSRNIRDYIHFDDEQKKRFLFSQFYKVFKHAYLNVPFYRDLYKANRVSLRDIRSYSDIGHIPVIKKSDLLKVSLEERSYKLVNRVLVNTGGSSGKPLSFYMDPNRYGNEWAHIHEIWSALGYKPSSLKLNFDGRSTVEDYIQYDFARNSLRFDIYADPAKACRRLLPIAQKYNIAYLHGYPSAIFEFALHCVHEAQELLGVLRKTLKGVFLVSEFPSPNYRNTIERVFQVRTQSFYGHTETCVIAGEKSHNEYSVYQTYGLAEAIQQSNGDTHLVGTSFFNFASPFIRYDTEDKIEVIKQTNGILDTFGVSDGRVGEYIVDKDGKRISLTGLIFGRHHKLFDVCKHIQVKQRERGEAIIFYVPSMGSVVDPEKLFDSGNVRMDFSFCEIKEPFRTGSGKIKLLVTDN